LIAHSNIEKEYPEWGQVKLFTEFSPNFVGCQGRVYRLPCWWDNVITKYLQNYSSSLGCQPP
jgi:hypothetical protein